MADENIENVGGGVIARLSRAYREVKARDESAKVNPLGLHGIERKSAPDFGQNHTSGWNGGFRFSGWGPNFSGGALSNTNVDYRREVGSLDGHSLVMCVVNYTGTRLPEAKPTILKKDKDGVLQPELSHPISSLIRRPNPHHVWANYCMALSLSWWIDGNVYFLKVRDLTGKVAELWYLPHFMVEPRWPGDGRAPEVPIEKVTNTFLSHYQYSIPGKAPVLYPAKDIIHLKRGINPGNPRSGLSAFEPLIKELYGDDKMALFTATIMRNMGIIVPLLAPKEKDVIVSPEQAAAIKEQWMQGTTGDNAGKPLVNSIALEATKFGFSPQELDLSALRMIPESRVAAVTGIPAATLQLLVGLQNGSSYASSEQARQQGYEEVVIPIQQSIAEELQWQLVDEFEDPQKVEFAFDTSNVRVLQEDGDALAKRLSTIYLANIIKRSEARQKLGYESTPEDEIYYEPKAAVPTEGQNPEDQPKGFGSVGDIEKYLGILETQMKDFKIEK